MFHVIYLSDEFLVIQIIQHSKEKMNVLSLFKIFIRRDGTVASTSLRVLVRLPLEQFPWNQISATFDFDEILSRNPKFG